MRKFFKAFGLSDWDSLEWKYRTQGALLALLVIALLAVVLLSGCGARSSVVGGESYLKTLSETKPGATTTTVTERVDLTPEGKPAATTTTRQVQVVPPTVKKETEARAVAGKSEIVGEDVKQDANISAPKVTGPDGMSADGGANESESAGAGSAKGTPLIIAAIVLGLGAGFCFWRGWASAGIACAAVAGAFLTIAIYPAVLLWVLLAVAVGLVGLTIYQARTGKNYKEALRAVVAGVELAPADAQSVVKGEIAKQVEGGDRETIRTIKSKDGL